MQEAAAAAAAAAASGNQRSFVGIAFVAVFAACAGLPGALQGSAQAARKEEERRPQREVASQ